MTFSQRATFLESAAIAVALQAVYRWRAARSGSQLIMRHRIMRLARLEATIKPNEYCELCSVRFPRRLISWHDSGPQPTCVRCGRHVDGEAKRLGVPFVRILRGVRAFKR